MNDSDVLGFLIMATLVAVLGFGLLALIAGNIVNQLLAPVPGVSGPMGAAAALVVFCGLLIKSGELVLG